MSELTDEQISLLWRQAELGDPIKRPSRLARSAYALGHEAGLKEAVEACARIADDCWAQYKGRAPYAAMNPYRADPDMHGRSYGAQFCAEAIRDLIDTLIRIQQHKARGERQ